MRRGGNGFLASSAPQEVLLLKKTGPTTAKNQGFSVFQPSPFLPILCVGRLSPLSAPLPASTPSHISIPEMKCCIIRFLLQLSFPPITCTPDPALLVSLCWEYFLLLSLLCDRLRDSGNVSFFPGKCKPSSWNMRACGMAMHGAREQLKGF